MRLKRWWKNRPYWLKGGLIGIGIFLVLILLLLTCSMGLLPFVDNPTYDCYSLLYPLLLFALLIQKIFKFETIGPWIQCLNILFFPLIGALIGWIIGKIKFQK